MLEMNLRPRVDETGGFNALEDVDPEQVIHLQGPIEVGTLAGGMSSGRPSVAFCFVLDDGRVVVAETSLALFASAARALSAAHEDEGDGTS